VRELIRTRIYQEVQDYNRKEPEYFRGLVEPTDAERVLNGCKLKANRKMTGRSNINGPSKRSNETGSLFSSATNKRRASTRNSRSRSRLRCPSVKLVPLVRG